MSIFLLETSTLTINRYSAGYYQKGDWVQGGAEPPFEIECNIQPYKKGAEADFLPQGTTTNEVLIIYTKTKLRESDQFDKTEGDYFELDGYSYKIYASENWNRYGLLTDHYKYYAVRKDLPTNGGL